MKINFFIFYLIIGLLFIGMLWVSRIVYIKGSTLTGITEARKTKLSSDRPVTVLKVFVKPGQTFQPGDTLITLTSNELNMVYAKVQNRIDKLQAEKIEKSKSLDARIRYLKSENVQDQLELDARIQQLEAELVLNRMVINDSSGTNESIVQPRRLMIQALGKQKEIVAQTTRIKIEDIIQQNTSEQALIDQQIILTEREFSLLSEEKKHLVKIASVAGVVEQLNAKVGESFDSFFTLIAYNPHHPSAVIAYLVGKRSVNLTLDDTVEVWSYNHPDVKVEGRIIGFGAVVALPEILQRSTAIKAFGKEVFIHLDANNGFYTGEKVMIR